MITTYIKKIYNLPSCASMYEYKYWHHIYCYFNFVISKTHILNTSICSLNTISLIIFSLLLLLFFVIAIALVLLVAEVVVAAVLKVVEVVVLLIVI